MANINKAQINRTNRTKAQYLWVNKRVTADQKYFNLKMVVLNIY